VNGFSAVAEERAPSPRVRDVTPPGIIRVYGVPEASGPSQTAASGVQERKFEHLRVMSDGSIRSSEEAIVLHGIELPSRDKLCVTSAGARWACGMSAIGALRAMLHDRTVTCLVRDQRDDKGIVGSCRIGQVDIGLRLLEQGWASLEGGAQDKRLVEAAEAGKSKRLGIWANGPTSIR
jgi:endonuclease YncB( thermonuclease family)